MTLLDNYNAHFETVFPNNIYEELTEVFKLRYQSYSLEHSFLAVNKDGLDVDADDAHSIHAFIKIKETGETIATTRIILPKEDILFPLEKSCAIDEASLPANLNRQHIAELSRFCISKDFRKKVIGVKDTSHITLALVAASLRISIENDIHYWFAFTGTGVIRVISKFGIYLNQIGPTVDFQGKRSPHIIDLRVMVKDVAEKNVEFWQMLTDNGKYQFKD